MKNLLTKTFILAVHLLALIGAMYSYFHVSDIVLTVIVFILMGFGITIGFHRYFAHCSFQTSRVFQFILAFWGSIAMQGGVLFWAAVHRYHHRHSDQNNDVHSPTNGFWHSHIGWLGHSESVDAANEIGRLKWANFPELRFLDRFYLLPPLIALLTATLIGYGIAGAQGAIHYAVWGYILPVVVVWHMTWSINSLTHMIGKRRFKTTDESRNSMLLGLFCLGEGWHNNHHYFPTSVRQGMYWYEIDISYYVILLFKRLGLIWKTVEYPDKIKK